MNRLRGDRVVVELHPKEEDKDSFENKGGLYVPKTPQKEWALRTGTIKLTGHLINPLDLKVGQTVYVKEFQGERLSPDSLEYLFKERDIVGND